MRTRFDVPRTVRELDDVLDRRHSHTVTPLSDKQNIESEE
jgi:hypothetical protein